MSEVSIDIEDLTEEQAKKLLAKIVVTLDELDGEDFFGTEGWKHMFELGV